MKKYFRNRRTVSATLIFLFTALGHRAEAAGGSTTSLADYGMYLLIAAAALVGLWAITTLLNAMDAVLRSREIQIYDKHGLDEYLETKKSNEGSWWKRFNRVVTNAVPIENERDILMDHDYDGIQELDNNLPPWWVYGFYLSIGIAVVYMWYFHFSDYGKGSREEYAIEMKEADEAIKRFLSKQANTIDENNVTLLDSEADLAEGQQIFNTNCIACHLESGGGSSISVGPNLTDEYWINGGGIVNVFKTVKYGVPEKGMISWQTQLRPADMHKVSSYIISLQGTNPPGAKAPQGELYVPEVEGEAEN